MNTNFPKEPEKKIGENLPRRLIQELRLIYAKVCDI
jgi:hypothetical protein